MPEPVLPVHTPMYVPASLGLGSVSYLSSDPLPDRARHPMGFAPPPVEEFPESSSDSRLCEVDWYRLMAGEDP